MFGQGWGYYEVGGQGPWLFVRLAAVALLLWLFVWCARGRLIVRRLYVGPWYVVKSTESGRPDRVLNGLRTNLR